DRQVRAARRRRLHRDDRAHQHVARHVQPAPVARTRRGPPLLLGLRGDRTAAREPTGRGDGPRLRQARLARPAPHRGDRRRRPPVLTMARARTRQAPRRRPKPPTPTQLSRRPADKPAVPEGWQPRITDAATLEEALKRLPTEHGVYIMRDRQGEIVYVGKAKSLRARVRQYFSGQDTRAFVPQLGKIVGDIETIVLQNNKEALLLENNLIKEHRPRFNVKLRDDSNYLVLRLDPRSHWPKLELVRNIRQDGAYYFGPYHSARSARATLRVVNRHFKLRTCTDFTLAHRRRPCLQYQIGRCPAPCVYDVDAERYAEQVKYVSLFLSGRHGELLTTLRTGMESAAEALDFERAARIR